MKLAERAALPCAPNYHAVQIVKDRKCAGEQPLGLPCGMDHVNHAWADSWTIALPLSELAKRGWLEPRHGRYLLLIPEGFPWNALPVHWDHLSGT